VYLYGSSFDTVKQIDTNHDSCAKELVLNLSYMSLKVDENEFVKSDGRRLSRRRVNLRHAIHVTTKDFKSCMVLHSALSCLHSLATFNTAVKWRKINCDSTTSMYEISRSICNSSSIDISLSLWYT